MYKENKPNESVLVLLDLVFQIFQDVFGGLKTWQNWVDLYMVLFQNKFKGDKEIIESLETEPELHPHCFNDLVHKTTLMFQSLLDVRLPFAEAQKRVTSTVCLLTGWKPTDQVR